MGILAGLRERKKERTRDALAETALALFSERGFEAVTVDDIAERAEISRRTFFRYFPAKEAAAFPRNDERLERFRKYLRRRLPEETPLGRVRRAALAMAREYVEDRAAMVAQHRVVEGSPALIAYERAMDLHWEAALAEGLQEGRGPEPERRARLLAGAVMGIIRATLREWFAADGRADLVAMGESALDVLEYGAAAPERRVALARRVPPRARARRGNR